MTVLGIVNDSLRAHLGLNFGEIAMQLGLYEDDTVEEFLDDGVLVLVVRVGYAFEADLSLLVHSGLRVGCGARMLNRSEVGTKANRQWGQTDDSNALNSCSLAFLYSSISLAASERASLSFCTLSAG